MAASSLTSEQDNRPAVSTACLVSRVPFDGSGLVGFDDLYQIEQQLQTGSYAVVYRVTTKNHQQGLPRQEYAAKIIRRQDLSVSAEKDVHTEVQLMQDLVAVNGVVKLVDFFANDDFYILVQTLAKGGDLFDRMKATGTYSEREARIVAMKLLTTIRGLHQRRTIHRDIKPENILIENPQDATSVLLADFGFATCLSEEGFSRRRCGTPTYIAPEVWKRKPYDYSCDMWSMGAVLYMLIDGLPPFVGESNVETCRLICQGQVDFESPQWDKVSQEAKDFISGLLNVDPEVRLTADQALESRWIQSGLTDALFDENRYEIWKATDVDLHQTLRLSLYPYNII